MQVQVRGLTGETKIYDLSQDSNVSELKNAIASEMSLEYGMMNLVSNGMMTVDTEKVINDVTYFLSLKMEGGKKKKKKRSYTSKKKTTHKHVAVKLGAINYYKVDSNGKVTYSQKSCPKCGPGIFMAKHYDRHYCGKCHLTLKIDAETAKKNLEELKKRQEAKKSGGAAVAEAAGGKKDAKKGKKGKK